MPVSILSDDFDHTQVLQELGLFEIRNSRIGGGLTRGISGGEKRRLSIGTELLTRPALLFLDEPTTGLGAILYICFVKYWHEVLALLPSGVRVVLVPHVFLHNGCTLCEPFKLSNVCDSRSNLFHGKGLSRYLSPQIISFRRR